VLDVLLTLHTMTRNACCYHKALLLLSRGCSAKLGRGYISSPFSSASSNLFSRSPSNARPSCTRAYLQDRDEVSLSCGSKVRVDTLGYRPNVAGGDVVLPDELCGHMTVGPGRNQVRCALAVVVFNKDGNVLSCRRFFRYVLTWMTLLFLQAAESPA
jgi:hypothetical protein